MERKARLPMTDLSNEDGCFKRDLALGILLPCALGRSQGWTRNIICFLYIRNYLSDRMINEGCNGCVLSDILLLRKFKNIAEKQCHNS